MRITYGSNGLAAFSTYDLYAQGEVMGWIVHVASHDGRPFILMRSKSWKGQQPRFVLTLDDKDFIPALKQFAVLRDSFTFGVGKVDFGTEPPVVLEAGLRQWESHRTESVVAWESLVGINPIVSLNG